MYLVNYPSETTSSRGVNFNGKLLNHSSRSSRVGWSNLLWSRGKEDLSVLVPIVTTGLSTSSMWPTGRPTPRTMRTSVSNQTRKHLLVPDIPCLYFRKRSVLCPLTCSKHVTSLSQQERLHTLLKKVETVMKTFSNWEIKQGLETRPK